MIVIRCERCGPLPIPINPFITLESLDKDFATKFIQNMGEGRCARCNGRLVVEETDDILGTINLLQSKSKRYLPLMLAITTVAPKIDPLDMEYLESLLNMLSPKTPSEEVALAEKDVEAILGRAAAKAEQTGELPPQVMEGIRKLDDLLKRKRGGNTFGVAMTPEGPIPFATATLGLVEKHAAVGETDYNSRCDIHVLGPRYFLEIIIEFPALGECITFVYEFKNSLTWPVILFKTGRLLLTSPRTEKGVVVNLKTRVLGEALKRFLKERRRRAS